MRLIAVGSVFAPSCLFVFPALLRFCYRCRLHMVHCLTLALIGFHDVRLSFAGDQSSLSDHFLTEAPQKEMEYRLFAKCLQGGISTTFTTFDPTGKIKKRMRSRKEVKQNEQCASFLYQSFDGQKTEIDDKRTIGGVYVVNPRYAFELKRDNSQRDWLLGNLDPHGNGASLNGGEPIHEMSLSWTSPMYDVFGRQISALVHERTFRVTHASAINRDGRNLVQIDFICPHPIQKHVKNYFVQGGSLLLDPDRYWCIKECDLRTQSINGNGTKRALFEFRDGSNRYPIVTRMVRTGKSPLGNVSEEVFEFDLHEVTKLPSEEEFTLSAFGLPEPMGVEPLPPSRNWLWLLAAAIIAAALAILFSWLKHRHTEKASRSSAAS